jgi:DNA-directed RNA polymerase specialized sigma24 family protein
VRKSEFVRLARDGDRDAYDVLVTDVIDHLYRIARLILRDFDSAEDAVQRHSFGAGETCHACGSRIGSTPGSTGSC